MKFEMNNTSNTMNIKVEKEEIKKVYSNYDKFVMYLFIFDLIKIVGDMYTHIMSDEKEIEEMGDEQ